MCYIYVPTKADNRKLGRQSNGNTNSQQDSNSVASKPLPFTIDALTGADSNSNSNDSASSSRGSLSPRPHEVNESCHSPAPSLRANSPAESVASNESLVDKKPSGRKRSRSRSITRSLGDRNYDHDDEHEREHDLNDIEGRKSASASSDSSDVDDDATETESMDGEVGGQRRKRKRLGRSVESPSHSAGSLSPGRPAGNEQTTEDRLNVITKELKQEQRRQPEATLSAKLSRNSSSNLMVNSSTTRHSGNSDDLVPVATQSTGPPPPPTHQHHSHSGVGNLDLMGGLGLSAGGLGNGGANPMASQDPTMSQAMIAAMAANPFLYGGLSPAAMASFLPRLYASAGFLGNTTAPNTSLPNSMGPLPPNVTSSTTTTPSGLLTTVPQPLGGPPPMNRQPGTPTSSSRLVPLQPPANGSELDLNGGGALDPNIWAALAATGNLPFNPYGAQANADHNAVPSGNLIAQTAQLMAAHQRAHQADPTSVSNTPF